LVHAPDEISVGALDVIVAVPAAVVELDETDSFFDHLACQQTLTPEGVGCLVADAV